jgi:hypothetical protein
MQTERTRSGAVLASPPLALVIPREIELLATRRGRLVAFDLEEIEAVAEHIAELVASARPKVGMIDARELAEELGVARDWVYANAERLGGCGWGMVRAGAVALRRRAGTTGTGGGRERRAATEQRSGAATAGTAPTGGCTYRRAPHPRQVQPVITGRAILRSSTYDGLAGPLPRPGG